MRGFVCFIFHPILSLIILLFAQLYFIFISLINCIFFCIIACLDGVEIHLDIYYNISNKDIISLVRGVPGN